MDFFAVAVLSSDALCFKKHKDFWCLNPINGEERYRLGHLGANLISELAQQQSNVQCFKRAEIYILYNSEYEQDSDTHYHCQLVAEAGTMKYHHIQMIDIANLLPKLSLVLDSDDKLHNISLWEQHILPLFEATYINPNSSINISVTTDAEIEEYLELTKRYQAKKLETDELRTKYDNLNLELSLLTQKLKQQNEQINEMAMRGDAIPVTDLVRFLPMFYRNFWEHISPEEFASVICVQEIPTDIQSIEPTDKVRVILRKQFIELPNSKKSYILKIVHYFQVVLGEIRPEFTSLLENNK